ncbi:restriction endonuclease subunit S [Roseburia sp. OM04-10BH]|uniref:restriction endonuclease subunit S n=1 Tax=unclassified Roseburia TaxID=2637578 RepID=UPI000E4E93C2|nr:MULTISPECIES: restriction endonuclease subunit S [unclassified Roseburia]RGI45738.1 restriction endonuclease subunit S [Roseburia sp. OM04-10BH]RHV41193.1 restriction endonuclease subunit S [Roseburia sp. OM04-15AA]
MPEWKSTRLGDICTTNKDSYSSKDNWKIVNYLDTGSITENKITELQYIDIETDKLPSRARRKVRKDSILYSTVRPNQLHYGIIKELVDNLLVSTGFTVIDVDTNKAIPEFIYYILTQKNTTEQLQAIAEQSVSTYPSIKATDIENLKLKLPNLAIQKKIVAILDTIDSKIRQNEKINNNLEQQAKVLYKDWFFDFSPFSSDGNLPDGWRLGAVGDIIQLHDSKRVPLSGAERDKMAKVYPYYGATSLMDYVDNYLFDGIYLLLGEDGTVVDSLGFPILQYIYGQFWVNNHAHIITGKEGFSVEELYLFFSLTNIKSIVTGAVQQKVSQQNLKKVSAIIPSKEALSAFDEIIQPIFAQIRNLRDENANLARLRDTLLPKLMSGELDVSDIDL